MDRNEPKDGQITRRRGLINGAKLAFTAPAVVAALRGGVAFADSGTKDTGTHASKASSASHASRASTATGTSTTATDTHTATGTSTLAEVAGLQQQYSFKLRAVSGKKDNKGALYFFGLNNQVQKIFARIKKAEDNAIYRLVWVAADNSNAANPTVLFTFQANGEGDFRNVVLLNPFFTLPLANNALVGTFYVQKQTSGGFTNAFVLRRTGS